MTTIYLNALPVFESVVATWRAIHREGFAMLAALAIPAVCISIIEFIAEDYPNRFPYSLLFWLAAAPFFVLFAVVCHRSIILGGASLPNRLGLFWSVRETMFLVWTVAIIIATWLLSIGTVVLSVLSPFGPIITILAIAVFLIYIYVRLAMVLPATAVEEERASFERAWFLTSGNGFRIILVIAFSAVPVVFATIVLLHLFGASFLSSFVAVLARHAIPLVAICALSVSYRELIEFETSALPD